MKFLLYFFDDIEGWNIRKSLGVMSGGLEGWMQHPQENEADSMKSRVIMLQQNTSVQ